jgi:hypothetical protein
MPFLPDVILSLLANFADVFTVPTWRYAQTLLIGAIICNGKRTVSSALRAMGLALEKRFERYHRVLSKAKWNEFALSKILLGLLIKLLSHGAPIIIAMDETIERRRGKKISTKGCYRDACRSSQSLVIKCFGLKWQCAALIIKLPWSNRCWALPFMTVLCPSKKHDEQKGLCHKSSIDRAMQMVYIISRVLKCPWILVGDGGFACLKLGHTCVKSGAILVSRLRLDAALFEEVKISPVKRRGRKPLKGSKIPTLKEQIKTGCLRWQESKIAWYGSVLKTVKLATGVNLWYTSGEKPLKIRWLLVQDQVTQRVEAFFSTDINMDPIAIVETFVLRWNIEVTFEEVRAHLGVETQRQWSEKAIRRTTPILMGLFSLVCLIAETQNKLKKELIQTATAAWYNKEGLATFADVLVYVKRLIIQEKYLNESAKNNDFVQIPRQKWEVLINNYLMAA